ncbi:MAG: HAMP domain-containing sensor histidine kinase [Polyangia bacterium]
MSEDVHRGTESAPPPSDPHDPAAEAPAPSPLRTERPDPVELLKQRDQELLSLQREYHAYRGWVERMHQTLAMLSTATQLDVALRRLVEALVTESAYDFAAVLSATKQTSYGVTIPESDEARVVDLANTARERGQLVIASLTGDQKPQAVLRWFMCGPITPGSGAVRSVDNDLVLLVARSERALALHPPPWEHEAQQFKHMLFTLAHTLSAVRYRAAVVTERNNLRQKVSEATAQLSAALAEAEAARQAAEDANQKKSAFLAIASHELRSPLNAIIGYAELLHDSVRGHGLLDLVADIQQIRDAARNLLTLIGNILDMSKIEAGKMELFLEDFELLELVTAVVRGLRPQLTRNNNRLHLSAEGGPFPIFADHIKVRQILNNILTNAAKFTQDGDLFVDIRRAASRNDQVEIVIRDTGIGMTPSQMQRLFRPFSQVDTSTHRHYGGTGLGLAIAQRFSQMMGGDIQVDSAPGQGSQFTVRLPVRVQATDRRSGAYKTLRV